MSSHSEEFWDSFDALWRRMEFLSRRVKDLEERLAHMESPAGYLPDEGLIQITKE